MLKVCLICVKLCLSLCTLLDRLEQLTAVRHERQASLQKAKLPNCWNFEENEQEEWSVSDMRVT